MGRAVYNVECTGIAFRCSLNLPMLIYKACLATDTVSQTVYCQQAVAEKLARDLGLDYDELMAAMPPPRTRAAYLIPPGTGNRNWVTLPGSSTGTVEDIK